MTILVIFLICVFLTLIIGVLAGLSDVKSMTIPNSYSVFVIALFFVCYLSLYLSGQNGVFGSLQSHLMSAGVTFLVTVALFMFRVLGAGDSKFGTACALWIGIGHLPIYLFFMTLFGGLLGVVALYIKRNKPFKSPAEGSWVAQVQGGADKVPYGVAITFGMLIAFVYSGYFSMDVLSSFVAVQPTG